jgi:hypothetical protein
MHNVMLELFRWGSELSGDRSSLPCAAVGPFANQRALSQGLQGQLHLRLPRQFMNDFVDVQSNLQAW